MWKPFQHNNVLYLIKLVKSEECIVYLNDLQNIWSQSLSEADILVQFQQLNPLLDVKLEEAVSQFYDLINNINVTTKIEIENSNNDLKLLLTSKVSEFQISFTFNFTKLPEDNFLKEVTVPLIQTVKLLEKQQKVLYNMLIKKDRELEEHKLEKGEISRTDLITDKFEENNFNNINDDKAMLNVFTNKVFWDKFVELHGDLSVDLLDVKTDPWNHIKRKKKVYSARTSRKKNAGIKYN